MVKKGFIPHVDGEEVRNKTERGGKYMKLTSADNYLQ